MFEFIIVLRDACIYYVKEGKVILYGSLLVNDMQQSVQSDDKLEK